MPTLVTDKEATKHRHVSETNCEILVSRVSEALNDVGEILQKWGNATRLDPYEANDPISVQIRCAEGDLSNILECLESLLAGETLYSL